MSKKVYKEKYFQHDRYARQDPKIKNMLSYFRKISEEKAKSAICVFWWIVEDMHTDDYPINNLDAFADDYRCDVEFLKSILENFDLFHVVNDCYVSDRVLKNLKEQEEKSEKAKRAIQARWSREKKQDTGDKPAQEINDDFINSIIQIYNSEFKKSQIVGNETRDKISQITKDNNLSLEIWQKVFENAKRGWNIKGEIKKPCLKNILENWDAFASDDYFLAPDEKNNQEQKEKEKKENEEAHKIISKNYLSIDVELTSYDEYRVLNDSMKLKAIEFYKSHNNSISETTAYIKKGLC